jgi:predicted nucleotidyltransferase
MKEIPAELLNEITRRLAESIQPERIYLFGSHAAGKPDDDSDVDLLAVVRDTDRTTREIAIEGRSSLSDFLIPFDLIVCTKSQFERYAGVKNTIMNENLIKLSSPVVDGLDKLTEQAKTLSTYAVDSRYPAPHGDVSNTEASEAVETARKIFECVLKSLPELTEDQ